MLVETPVPTFHVPSRLLSRHGQERVDHVRDVDQIPPLLARAVDQDGLPCSGASR